MRNTACQPSDACLMLPDAGSASGSFAPTPCEADTFRTIGSTVGKASGVQKIVCS
jgi:hypothetical protein